MADVAELISLSFFKGKSSLVCSENPRQLPRGRFLFNWFLFHRDQGRCLWGGRRAGCGTRRPCRRRSFFESSASAQVVDVSQPLSVGCPHCNGKLSVLIENNYFFFKTVCQFSQCWWTANCFIFCPCLYIGHHGRLDYRPNSFLLPCLSHQPSSQIKQPVAQSE